MKGLWNKGWWVAAFIVAGAAFAMAAPTRMPRPGLLNSVQGHVTLNAHPAAQTPMRWRALRAGHVVATRHGKASLLLTPGSFLRIGNNSAVRMLSRSLENTRVWVVKGMAIVDVQAGYKHDLAIIMDRTTTRINKNGIYGFNANAKTISVLHGKATVYQGDSRIRLNHKRQLYIASRGDLQLHKLNKRAFKSSSLYQWNKARNRYEARARRSVQQRIAQTGRWFGPGWYWSHYWGFYAYVPSAGAYLAPYYGPNYGAWGWNDWDWGGGWGWGDGDGD